MLKLLLKLQISMLTARLLRKNTSIKKNSRATPVLFALLFVYLFAVMGGMFYVMASALCPVLYESGMGWLYFAMLGGMAVTLGVVGSVFTAWSALYRAKDNDLLLSLPIKPGLVLVSRTLVIYLSAFAFEAVVWIPGMIARIVYGAGLTVMSVLAQAVLLFLLPLLSTVAACLLGYVLALVFSRIKSSSFVTVILSLGFIAGYYYMYSKLNTYLQYLMANIQQVGANIRARIYPLYALGTAADGDVLMLAAFIAASAVLFAAVYMLLSASFLKLASAGKSAGSRRKNAVAVKSVSVSGALFRRELLHFTSNANYMLNCAMGSLLMPVAIVALAVKGGDLMQMILPVFAQIEGALPIVACYLCCMMAAMNVITAPSVSLEGRSISLIQSLPVTPWQVLQAKLRLHLVMTLPPALAVSVCVCAVLKPAAEFYLLIPAVCLLFAAVMAHVGLFLNLKLPNLDWTSEVVPVKQGMSVMLSLFGGWAAVVVLAVPYFAVKNAVPGSVYLLCAAAVLAAVAALLRRWLKTRGSNIFAQLQP